MEFVFSIGLIGGLIIGFIIGKNVNQYIINHKNTTNNTQIQISHEDNVVQTQIINKGE